MKKLMLILIGTMAVIGCNQLTNKQSERIQSLNETISEARESIISADTAKINEAIVEFEKNINFLMNKVSDTIDRKLAIHVSKYHRLEKSFSQYTANYRKTIEDLDVLKNQLSNLEHDGKKGILEAEQLDKYLQDEVNNIQLAVANATDLTNVMEILNYQYDSLRHRVDSLVEAYKIQYAE